MANVYTVFYGFAWSSRRDFTDLAEAAQFYRDTPFAQLPMDLERADGAEDCGNPGGLTEDERERVGL